MIRTNSTFHVCDSIPVPRVWMDGREGGMERWMDGWMDLDGWMGGWVLTLDYDLAVDLICTGASSQSFPSSAEVYQCLPMTNSQRR